MIAHPTNLPQVCPRCKQAVGRRRLGEELDQAWRAEALGLDLEAHSYLAGALLEEEVDFVTAQTLVAVSPLELGSKGE